MSKLSVFSRVLLREKPPLHAQKQNLNKTWKSAVLEWLGEVAEIPWHISGLLKKLFPSLPLQLCRFMMVKKLVRKCCGLGDFWIHSLSKCKILVLCIWEYVKCHVPWVHETYRQLQLWGLILLQQWTPNSSPSPFAGWQRFPTLLLGSEQPSIWSDGFFTLGMSLQSQCYWQVVVHLLCLKKNTSWKCFQILAFIFNKGKLINNQVP